ncbi:hypothetical protein D9M69_413500 [compost metagenome]
MMVMIAGSPSGIAEAVRATTIMNISAGGWRCQKMPSTKVSAAKTRITSASQRLKRSICLSSGVEVSCTCWSMAPMRPSSVSLPVPTTRPRAWPLVTRVPE